MIIEDLIRLGKPLLGGGLNTREILELISDVNDEKVKNFFRHVFVVEIPSEDQESGPIVLPMQVWGEEAAIGENSKKTTFMVDTNRAIGAPFVLPVGGNPLKPQGRYGVPVYPMWENHIKGYESTNKHVSGFIESSESIEKFLVGRLERTPGFNLSDAMRKNISKELHIAMKQLVIDDREKFLGILILVKFGDSNSPYTYHNSSNITEIGQSLLYPDKFIIPQYDRILDAVWEAKLQESKSVGIKKGSCAFCGKGNDVVSSYNKAWPLALPEWNCPLPKAGAEEMWIEGVALDESCCRALTLGAKILSKTTRVIHAIITHELFSPTSDTEAKKMASKRKLSDLPTIYGSAYIVPIHDQVLNNEEIQQLFPSNIHAIIKPPPKKGSFLDRYIDSVIGFDLALPEDVEHEDYRLSLIYFHGDPGRGDIHLRAFIQDAIPSTLFRLRKLARKISDSAENLLIILSPDSSDKQLAYYRRCYQSLPYLLARAYGGSYLWDQLEKMVHRRTLDLQRPTMNAARRMNSLLAGLHKKETRNNLKDEVIFYLTFLEFVQNYNEKIAIENQASIDKMNLVERSNNMMRPWREMIKAISEDPIETLQYSSPAEIGFGCGVLIRQFGRWYWKATKTGKEGKDYLKHRVLTFGSDLSPDVVWKRALGKMFDVAARYEKIKISNDFRRRVGVTLAEFDRLQEEVRANRDAFMAAFWSGYALQGYDKQEKSEQDQNEIINERSLS